MPVPNRPIYIKKLAGAVAFYSAGKFKIVQLTTTNSCDYQNPATNCQVDIQFGIQSPDGAVITSYDWKTSYGSITTNPVASTIFVGVNRGTSGNGFVTCSIIADGEPHFLELQFSTEHNDISIPISIVSIDRNSGGSCIYQPGDTCSSSGVYSVTTENGNGNKTYEWALDGPAFFPGTRVSPTVTVETIDSDTDQTFTLFCNVTDSTGTTGSSQIFTDTRVEDTPISIVSINKDGGGTCEYPTAGTCASTTYVSATLANDTGPVTYVWSSTTPGVVVGSSTTATPSFRTPQGNTNFTFNVTCRVTDSNSTNTLSVDMTDTKTVIPLAITSVNRVSGGTCQTTGNSPTCVSSGTYSVTTTNGSGAKSYLWTCTGATVSNATSAICTVTTASTSTPVLFNLTCVVTDSTGSPSKTQSFTDTRTAEPPITITDFYYSASGNSCEFPSGGTCSATGTILSFIANATGTVTYNWTATNGVTFVDNTVQNPTTNSPASNTNLTFDVTLTVTDDNSTATSTKTFTDSKTQEVVVRIAVANGGLASRSTDNGATWSALPQGLNSGFATNNFSSVCALGDTVLVSSGVANQNGSRSTDRGVTWSQGTVGPIPFNCIATNGSIFITAGNSGVGVRSTNDGVTFPQMLPNGLNSGSTTAPFTSVAANGNTWVIVSSAGWASRSTDNGITWAALPQGLNSGLTAANLRSVAANGNTWVAVGFDGRASRSTNDGATWTALPQGLNSGSATPLFRSVAANGNTWVAVSFDGWASRSTNNGATWSALPQGLNSGLTTAAFTLVTAAGSTWVAVSFSGWASRSTDDGVTWTALPQGLNSGSTTASFNSVS